MTITNNNTINKIRVQTIREIKEKKKNIPSYTGVSLTGNQFESGKMTVLRRSLQDVFEHSLDDTTIWQWLRSFDINSLQSMRYKGWAPNRPYPKDHPKYDPKHPEKPKHCNDTNWFNYYTILINNKEYWVNVKCHKNFGEVIYVIENEQPTDLIEGHKKSDIENVYSFLPGTGAI